MRFKVVRSANESTATKTTPAVSAVTQLLSGVLSELDDASGFIRVNLEVDYGQDVEEVVENLVSSISVPGVKVNGRGENDTGLVELEILF